MLSSALTKSHYRGNLTRCQYRNPKLRRRAKFLSRWRCVRSSELDLGLCLSGTNKTAAFWFVELGDSARPMFTRQCFQKARLITRPCPT